MASYDYTQVERLEAKQARDGKALCTVTLMAIDPLGRISRMEVDYQPGDPRRKPWPETQPPLGTDAGHSRRTLPVTYAKQRGTVELELTELPPP